MEVILSLFQNQHKILSFFVSPPPFFLLAPKVCLIYPPQQILMFRLHHPLPNFFATLYFNLSGIFLWYSVFFCKKFNLKLKHSGIGSLSVNKMKSKKGETLRVTLSGTKEILHISIFLFIIIFSVMETVFL